MLSGSLFIRNAITNDYCIEASIESLCALCEEVVVIDAESNDGTVDILREMERTHNNLKIHEGYKWACERENQKGYDRLAVLANTAKALTHGEWHFMLQADEVLHEDSIPIIQGTIKNTIFETFTMKRINLFGSIDSYLREDIYTHCGRMQPCGIRVCRLGKHQYDALGDAESIYLGNNNTTIDATIVHYGLVRDSAKMLDKVIQMQKWFHGKDGVEGTPDQRIIKQKKELGYLNPKEFFPDADSFLPLNIVHPKFAKKYVERIREETKKLRS